MGRAEAAAKNEGYEGYDEEDRPKRKGGCMQQLGGGL